MLAPADRPAARMEVDDLSHQHGADLNLGGKPEVVGPEEGVFPAVLRENRPGMKGDGADGVQLARQKDVGALHAAVKVAVAVVVVHAQAEDQTQPVPKWRRQPCAAKQRGDGVPALLDRQNRVVTDGPNAESAVAGGNQRSLVRRQGAQLRANAAGEAVVEAGVGLRLVGGKVDPGLAQEGTDQRLGQRRVQKMPGCRRQRSGDQRLQQKPTGGGPVEEAQQHFVVGHGDTLLSYMESAQENSPARMGYWFKKCSRVIIKNSAAPRATSQRMPLSPGLPMRILERKRKPVSRAVPK